TVTATLRLRQIGNENAPRTLTIRFAQTKSGEETTQTIYATEMSGTNRPIIELASSWPLQQLEIRVADLRDMRLLDFDRARVATVTLHSAAGVILLEGAAQTRSGPPAWSVRQGDGRATNAKASEVFALLYKLWSFTADEPTEQDATAERLAAVGLGDGAPTIELHDRSRASLGALRFGALHGDRRWVTRVGSAETRLAPINRIDGLPLHFGAYADEDAAQKPGH
ncbi:MAG: hypothetical protein V3T05_05640, partial [Myxococcota bacterium]